MERTGWQKSLLPIGFYVDERRMTRSSLVKRLVQPSEVRLAIVCVFPICIGMMNDLGEVRPVRSLLGAA